MRKVTTARRAVGIGLAATAMLAAVAMTVPSASAGPFAEVTGSNTTTSSGTADQLCFATEPIGFYRESTLVHREYTVDAGTPIRVHHHATPYIWYGHAEGHSDDYFVARHSDLGAWRIYCPV